MRIVLIEDDMVLGAAVRDQIAADGHSVDWVQRLDAAGDAMAGASFDLVLLDLMLPDGRGIPFLRRLRARGDVTPVIILTARDGGIDFGHLGTRFGSDVSSQGSENFRSVRFERCEPADHRFALRIGKFVRARSEDRPNFTYMLRRKIAGPGGGIGFGAER